MKTGLIIFQIFLSLTLTFLIFLQAGNESDSRSNLASTVNFEKRGWEKTLFNFTFFILTLFILSSIAQTLL